MGWGAAKTSFSVEFGGRHFPEGQRPRAPITFFQRHWPPANPPRLAGGVWIKLVVGTDLLQPEQILRHEAESEVGGVDGGGAGSVDKDDFGGDGFVGGAGGDCAFGDQDFLAFGVDAQVDDLMNRVRGGALVSEH